MLKSIFRIAFLLLLFSPLASAQLMQQGISNTPAVATGAATWTLVSSVFPAGGGGSAWDCNTTCASFNLGFTVPSGDVLVACVSLGADAYILSGDTTYGTWVTGATVPGLVAYQGPATQAGSCAYVLVTSSVSSVVMGYNIDADGYARFYDFHKSSGTISAETVPSAATSASCGSSGSHCTSPAISITGANDVIITMANFGDTACTVASPFTAIHVDVFGDASAYQLNTTSGTGASWTQGTACPVSTCGTVWRTILSFQRKPHERSRRINEKTVSNRNGCFPSSFGIPLLCGQLVC